LANRFGSLDCGVESTIKISILPTWQHAGECGTTEGVLERDNCELLTGLVGTLPGGQVNTKIRRSSQDRTRVRAAVAGRWNRASVPRTRQRTSEIGVDSGKARPAPRLVRGGSVSSEAYIFHRARLFHRDDIDRSGRQRTASSPLLSLERELVGTERGTESPTEMPSAPRAQTEGS